MTVKVGKVRPFSPAEAAGLKTLDYIWQINGKEVFDMDHNTCVKEIKESGNSLALSIERSEKKAKQNKTYWRDCLRKMKRRGNSYRSTHC